MATTQISKSLGYFLLVNFFFDDFIIHIMNSDYSCPILFPSQPVSSLELGCKGNP